jgi:hypothetical protein
MNKDGFPTHLTRTVQSMYQNVTTIMMKGCSLAPVLFNASSVKVIKDGLQVIKQNTVELGYNVIKGT